MKKIFKIMISIIIMITLATTCAGVSAAVYTLPRADSDVKNVISTTHLLSNSTTLTVDIPLITTCTVRSSGYSWYIFNANGTGCTRSFVGHSINIQSGGIGVININLGPTPISMQGTNGDKTYSFDTDRVEYTVYQIIWRLYYYNETHVSTNKLKLSNGTVYSTIMNSTYINW
ncbi:MAG: hypothetical protein ACYCYI_08170 [Saccharofermentanales bacterium]